MLKGIYAIHDLEANCYHNPLVFVSDVDARRHFHMMCKNQPSVREFKNDLVMEKVGTFDDITGIPNPCTPEVVITGSKIQFKDGE